jgi:chemotaxis protein methyltransferase CheR
MRIVACSQFFLNPEVWIDLAANTLPALVKERGSLRVWCAGGGTGKEPFSAAMILDQIDPSVRHSITATDTDSAALAVGRNGGPYNIYDIDTLSDDERVRYLQPAGPPWFVNARIRDAVAFHRHDLRDDPYPSQVDWILFRDVEPFFTPELTAAIHRKLCDALTPGGIIFVGAVESIADASSLGLERIRDCVYRKRDDDERLVA